VREKRKGKGNVRDEARRMTLPCKLCMRGRTRFRPCKRGGEKAGGCCRGRRTQQRKGGRGGGNRDEMKRNVRAKQFQITSGGNWKKKKNWGTPPKRTHTWKGKGGRKTTK